MGQTNVNAGGPGAGDGGFGADMIIGIIQQILVVLVLIVDRRPNTLLPPQTTDAFLVIPQAHAAQPGRNTHEGDHPSHALRAPGFGCRVGLLGDRPRDWLRRGRSGHSGHRFEEPRRTLPRHRAQPRRSTHHDGVRRPVPPAAPARPPKRTRG